MFFVVFLGWELTIKPLRGIIKLYTSILKKLVYLLAYLGLILITLFMNSIYINLYGDADTNYPIKEGTSITVVLYDSTDIYNASGEIIGYDLVQDYYTYTFKKFHNCKCIQKSKK